MCINHGLESLTIWPEYCEYFVLGLWLGSFLGGANFFQNSSFLGNHLDIPKTFSRHLKNIDIFRNKRQIIF